MDITLKVLQEMNRTRGQRWHRGGLENWSPLEWTGAMAGEGGEVSDAVLLFLSTALSKHTGEACNAAKKLKRVEGELDNHDLRNPMIRKVATPELAKEYRDLIAKECADTIMYAVLTIDRIGADAQEVIRRVFNEKSEEYGFPERL